jgi:hypothetical protein
MAKVRLEDVGKALESITLAFFEQHVKSMAVETVRRIPADTGAAKGSVLVTPAFPLVEYGRLLDPSGGQTISRINDAQLTLSKPAFVTVGAPYAGLLEQGSSSQAPRGFISVTVFDAQIHANRVAKGLK